MLTGTLRMENPSSFQKVLANNRFDVAMNWFTSAVPETDFLLPVQIFCEKTVHESNLVAQEKSETHTQHS